MRRAFRAIAAALGLALLLTTVVSPAEASTPKTPRNFTGYGFDQCNAPSQAAMDAWLRTSKFWAVGIYISGSNRYCKDQANLTPEWVRTQLRNKWRLLPLTVGPQAACNDRYAGKPRIRGNPDNNFEKARAQARKVADNAVSAAVGLGIPKGSTLWYDLEHFDTSKHRCRESALYFLSAWTNRLHKRGYVSGVYSNASSGIKALDDARIDRPRTFSLPDRIWFADWNRKTRLTSTYFTNDGWMPHGRVHQYHGDHVEKHGGHAINIDSNFLSLGRGSVPGKAPRHCKGVNVNLTKYPVLSKGDQGDTVRTLQCLLKEQGYFPHKINGRYLKATVHAVLTYRADHGFGSGPRVIRTVWTSILAQGPEPLLKYGAAGEAVRRLQRALNAAVGAQLDITGVFAQETRAAVNAFRGKQGLPTNGVLVNELWAVLKAGG